MGRHQDAAAWDNLTLLARAFAYSFFASTSLRLPLDPEDIAQEAILATIEFARKRSDELEDFHAFDEEFLGEIRAYMGKCLTNRCVGEARKARRRAEIMPIDADAGDEVEAIGTMWEDQAIGVEQRLIYQSLIDTIGQRARTDAERRFIETLKDLDVHFDKDSKISPSAVNRIAGVSAEQVRKFADRSNISKIIERRND